MIQLSHVYLQKENVVLREIAGEALLVPISGDLADLERLFSLNHVGAFIWKSLENKMQLEELANAVFEEYDTDKEKAIADLQDLIAQLLDAGLIVLQP